MTDRLLVAMLYTDDFVTVQLGYTKRTKAVCVLNDVIEAFTVVEDTKLFSRKKEYWLIVQLPLIRTGRAAGQKKYDTLDEAIEGGKTFVRNIFPEYVFPDVPTLTDVAE